MGKNRSKLALFLAALFVATPLTTASTLPQQKETPNYRLGDKIYPTSYEILIKPLPTADNNDFDYFDGAVTIHAIVNENLEEFSIHVGQEITILGDILVKKNGNVSENVSYEKDIYYSSNNEYEGNDLYHLNVKLAKGDKVQIYINYSSSFPSGMYGFYKSYYTDNGEERVLLTTQFETTFARNAFPCFDEPRFKATFTLSLIVPKGYYALSATEVVTDDADDPNKESVTIKFSPTPKMPTYTLAIVIYDTSTFTKVENKTEHFNTWGRKSEMEDGKTELSQIYGPKLRDAMGEYAGIKYTLDEVDDEVIENKPTKIDQAAIPDFSVGAMENWGLITYRETALLFKEGRHSETAKKRVITVIAHEIAHQWFGNLLTAEWWSTIWLHEAFANYFEYYLTDVVTREENWRMNERFVVDEQMKVLAVDAFKNSPPLTNTEVNSASSASAHMGTISYSKGGSFVRMITDIIGHEKFQNNMKNYMKKFAGKTVKPENLFTELVQNVTSADTELPVEEQENLKLILERWTIQNGFPLIMLARDGNGAVVIQQVQFLLDAEGNNKYDIKLTLLSNQEDFTTTRWLLHHEDNITLEGLNPNQWVLVKSTGYFRVNYDTENWQALIHELQTKGRRESDALIEPLERAVLLDNALILARAEIIAYTLAIEVLSYLENESDFIPWYAVSTNLDFLHRMLINVDEGEPRTINKYILAIIEYVYTELENNEPKTHTEKVHHANIFNWACRVGHVQCLETVEKYFVEYMAANDNEINADISNTVYCYGVKNNENDWIQLWNKLQDEEDAIIRSVLISALGCSSSKSTLFMYLETAISGNSIREQDIASVFAAVYSNPDGIEVSLEFLEKRITAVVERTKTLAHGMRNIINGIAQYLNTEDEKNRLQAIGEREDLELPVKLIINDAITTVAQNIKWKETFEEEVLDALKKKLSANRDYTKRDIH